MTNPSPTLFRSASTYDPPRIKSLPVREQPAFRVVQNAAGCNLSELLAAVIGGAKQIETAESVLTRFGGDLRRLHQAHAAELTRVKGINPQTAARIKAALTLGLRLNDPIEERPIINSPSDAAALVQHEMGLLQQEYLKVMLLDTRNHLLDVVEVYHGSVNCSQVRIAEVFKPAVERMATAIIALHNHPSQDVSPSPDDISVTRAMLQAGKLLDIALLDHLIISSQRFVSLKERGLGFT